MNDYDKANMRTIIIRSTNIMVPEIEIYDGDSKYVFSPKDDIVLKNGTIQEDEDGITVTGDEALFLFNPWDELTNEDILITLDDSEIKICKTWFGKQYKYASLGWKKLKHTKYKSYKFRNYSITR